MFLSEDSHDTPRSAGQIVWDIVCAASLIGIWPRYVEPNLLTVSRVSIPIANLPEDLRGLRIVHLSDLHLSSELPDAFLNKVVTASQAVKPDLIVFTGDFLCYGQPEGLARLERFLKRFSAPLGCFAVLGNHDYEAYVGVNAKGEYDILPASSAEIVKVFRRITHRQKVLGKFSKQLQDIELQSVLTKFLKKTPFTLLENSSQKIAVGKTFLNICGLGEYSAGRCCPESAYRNYDRAYPGIILAHNPDAVAQISAYPGDLVLCGHIHGGQINLPWLVNRFTLVEHPEFRSGLFRLTDRLMYVSRGIGSVLRLRWRARPEVVVLTLT